MVHVLRGRSVRDFMLCSAGASGEDMLCCITEEHENDVSDLGREVLSSFSAVLLSSVVQSTWSP